MSGSLLEVKKKIIAVQNTSKITKAMQLVAASKMRLFQKRALNTRQHTWNLFEILQKTLKLEDSKLKNKSIFTKKRTTGKTLFVLYTSDKGLCGPLNNKLINGLFRSNKWNSTPSDQRLLITIGKKSYTYAQNNHIPVLKHYIGLPEKISNLELIKIVDFILEYWQYGENGPQKEKNEEDDIEEIDDFDIEETKETEKNEEMEEDEEQLKEVVFVAPHYKNSFTFYPVIKNFLPLNQETITSNIHISETENTKNEETDNEMEFDDEFTDGTYMLFSPSEKKVVEKLHELIIQGMFMQAFLELKASEYSSRMIAMQNATDAAKRIIGDLQLAYNKARQQTITQEIAELIGASMAISENE